MMETIDYQVVPEWGNPLGFFLLAREKGIRWHVSKVFEDERMMAYHYRFTHLGARGNPVSPAAYAGHALNLGISRSDNERAARWFLTQYFSFRELHYTFSSILGGAQGSYYPVLCRRFVPRSDFELSWES